MRAIIERFGGCLAVLMLLAGGEPADADTSAFVVPKIKDSPTLDGKITDAEWADALETPPFVSIQGDAMQPTTRAWLAQDSQGIWIAVDCEEPRPHAIRSELTRRNGRVWLDDAIELFLDLNHDQQTYLHLVVNTQGVLFAQRAAVPPTSDTVGPWHPWVQFASAVGERAWTAELYLPFASLPPVERAGNVVGINICRVRMAGGAEQFSCLAPTFDSFHTPAAFADLSGLALPEGAGFDWPAIEARREGDRVVIDTPDDSFLSDAALWRVAWEDAGGRTIAQHSLSTSTLSCDDVPDQATSVRLIAVDRQGGIEAVSDPLAIESYRDVQLSVFQPYVDVERELDLTSKVTADWRNGLAHASWVLRDAAGLEVERGEFDDLAIETFTVPVESLDPGDHTVELHLVHEDGAEAIGRASFTKLRPPQQITHVAFDEDRVLRVDGQPFLPIGLYRITPNLWGEWLADTGFNTVHEMGAGAGRFERNDDGSITWTTSLDEIEATLDRAHELGLKVLFELGVYVKEVFEVEPGEEDGARLREVVSRFRRHPAILAYYLIDEPYAQHYERAQRAKEMVEAIDPHHPTLSPSLGRSFYYKPTAELVDGLLISSYPLPYRPIGEVGRDLDIARSVVGRSKPILFVPQAVGLRGSNSLPSAGELANMTYQAMTRRVSGLVYFAWFGDRPRQNDELGVHHPRFWQSLVELTKELQTYRQPLLAPAVDELPIQADRGLDVSVRAFDNEVWVLAVNTQRRSAELRMEGVLASYADWRDVRKPEREVIAEGGGLEITLEPLAVALLRTKATAGEPSESRVVASYTDARAPDEDNLLRHGGFEAGTRGWELQGRARRTADMPYEGKACVAMTAPGASASAVISEAISVEPGQRLHCQFYVRVNARGEGNTVDAKVVVLNADGEVIEEKALVGWDERQAAGFEWQWMGRTVEMPDHAAAVRVSLGTRGNPGVTMYDAVRLVDEKVFDHVRE